MPKATLQFGEWRPDLANLDNQYANIADNVFATLNSYQPIPGLQPITNTPIPTGPAMGLFPVRRNDATWEIYAGTKTRLYKYTPSGASVWTDVSRTVGGNYNVPDGELWQGVQFGQTLICVQMGDVPQAIDVETGTNFNVLSATAPRSHNVQIIGDFLVLGGLVEGSTYGGMPTNRRMIAWSAINDPTSFVPSTNLSDFQLFPDCGPVLGVGGNETVAYVVQDRGIRLMQFLPGDINTIFNFTKILHDRGAVGEFCFRTVGDVFFFINEDGFYSLAGGGNLQPIGEDKVNHWFMANSDRSRRNMYQIIPTNRPYVAWAFHSPSAPTGGPYDRVIIYNWANQRWTTGGLTTAGSPGSLSTYVWALLGSHYIDLDTDSGEPHDPVLDPYTTTPGVPGPNPIILPSLDSFAYAGGRPTICAIDANGILCALNGPNLNATLETPEAHLVPGMRAFCSEAYPLIDGTGNTVPTAGGVTVSVSTRERLGELPTWGDPIPLEVTGSASVTTSARLHRFRVLVPKNETWTNAQGVLAEAQPDGHA